MIQQVLGTGSSQASRGALCPPDRTCDTQPQCPGKFGAGRLLGRATFPVGKVEAEAEG